MKKTPDSNLSNADERTGSKEEHHTVSLNQEDFREPTKTGFNSTEES